MKAILPAAAILGAWCSFADAKPSFSKDTLIRSIADATAWSELCVNWSIDPQAVAQFRRNERISVDGHYREVYGFAFAKNHNRAMHGGNFPAACDRALALYGPYGQKIPGLVRSLWNGTVPGQSVFPIR